MKSRKIKYIWQFWKRFAQRVGIINSYILLFLFYFLIFAPFAVIGRILRRDFLDIKFPPKSGTSYWKIHEGESTELEKFKNQF